MSPRSIFRNSIVRVTCGWALACAGGALAQTPGDTAQAVTADAAGRSSLIGAPSHGGHDGKFHLRSADDRYRLDLRFTTQFRYFAVFDADDAGDRDDVVTGFDQARHEITFQGRAIDPRLAFKIKGAFKTGGSFRLDDAIGTLDVGEGTSLRWGQWKIPFDRAYAQISGTRGLAVERSLTTTIFRVNRSQGVGLAHDAGRWRLFGTVSDGRRAANTAFFSDSVADVALTGRAEARFGKAGWKAYGDATSFRGAETGVLLGLGGHWQQDGRDLAAADATGTTNLFQVTADVSVEGDGWNLLALGHWRIIDSPSPTQDRTLHDLAFNLQGGVFVCDHAELFARYEHIFPDTDRVGADDDFPGFVLGANWYFIPSSHAAKLTGQVMWFPETQADAASIVGAPNTGVGLAADDSGSQVAVAWQFQLLF